MPVPKFGCKADQELIDQLAYRALAQYPQLTNRFWAHHLVCLRQTVLAAVDAYLSSQVADRCRVCGGTLAGTPAGSNPRTRCRCADYQPAA